MRILTYTLVNNLNQLHDELLAAIPAVRAEIIDGQPTTAVMLVRGLNNTVKLHVPDAVDEATIQTVIDAHTPA